jgi:hypothetical protein
MARRTTNCTLPITCAHLHSLCLVCFKCCQGGFPRSSNRTSEYLRTKWRLAATAPVSPLHTYKVLFSTITRPLHGCICNVTTGLKPTTTTLLPMKWNPPMNDCPATSDDSRASSKSGLFLRYLAPCHRFTRERDTASCHAISCTTAQHLSQNMNCIAMCRYPA